MRFSTQGSVAAAMVASLATATPHNDLLGLGSVGQGLPLGKGLDLSQPISANVDLEADLSRKVLVAGLLADIVVDPIAEVAADAKVAVVCEDCHIHGAIDASISLEKVVPALSLSLKDVEVLLDLDVYIGAAATIAVNLVAPAKVSLPLPGLNVEALVYLDLILGVHTELDLSAGVYVSLPEASLETDILSGNILDVDFSGVVVKVLPIKVRIGCTELLADLRLRVELAVAAELDVDDVLPLDELLPGLDIPDIEAGLELAVFVNLLEYVGLFCAAPECPLAKEVYGLNIGAAVEVGVAVEDLLSIHLAPTVATAVLSIPTNTICIPTYTASPPPYSGLPGPSYSGIPTGIPTSSFPSFPTSNPISIPTSTGPNGEPTSTGPETSSAASSSTGLASEPTSTGPDGSATATSSFPGSTGVPSSSGPGSEPSSSGADSTGVGSSTGVESSTGVASSSSAGSSSGTPTSGLPGSSSTAAVTTPAPGGDDGYVTSTITETSTFTVTACAVNVPNCPAGYQTSVTLIHTTSYTIVCPAATATGSITAGPVPTTTTGDHNIQTITKHVTTMVPCDSTSTFVPPTEISTVPYPSDVPTHPASTPVSVPVSTPAGTPVGSSSPSTPAAGFPGTSVPAVSSPSLPAGGIPSGSVPAGFPTPSLPAGSVPVSSPAGGPSASYSAGAVTPSGPAVSVSSSYPAGGASVSTPVAVPSVSYPAVTGGCGGAGCPTSAPGSYPSVPAGPVYPGAGNSTVPATFATYQPSATTPAGYPTTPAGTTPIATAGVGKVGSSVAAVVAVMGAVLAL